MGLTCLLLVMSLNRVKAIWVLIVLGFFELVLLGLEGPSFWGFLELFVHPGFGLELLVALTS